MNELTLRQLIPFSENPLKTLGIPKAEVAALRLDQLSKLVKGFYKALQTVYHSDVSGGDEKRSAELNSAYEFLIKDSENLGLAKDLYLMEDTVNTNKMIGEINRLEQLIKETTAKNRQINQTDKQQIEQLQTENERLIKGVYSLSNLIEPPKNAVLPHQYTDFIFLINMTLIDTIQCSGMPAQILKDNSFHLLNSPRTKYRPNKEYPKVIFGIDHTILPEESYKSINRTHLRIQLDAIKQIAFALQPYIVPTGGLVLLQDSADNQYQIYKFQKAIPKSEFKDKKYKVIEE